MSDENGTRHAVKPSRSALMRRVRCSGTAPEIEVRRILRELGIHYRTNVRSLPGSPDIVHKGRGKAMFVHGCFWHHHTGCKRASMPKSNSPFWKRKFEENRARDERKLSELDALGFDVLVVWECELDSPELLKKRLADFWAA